MKNKKTLFMWFMIAATIINSYLLVMYFFFSNFQYYLFDSGIYGVNIVLPVFNLVFLAISLMYFKKLFQNSKTIYYWSDLYGVFSLLQVVASIFLVNAFYVSRPIDTAGRAAFFLFVLIVWAYFKKHLKSAEKSGLIVLN